MVTSMDDLQLAEAVARAAGAVALGYFRSDLEVATKRHASDPVTVADRQAQAAMVPLLRSARPRDGILGEEDGLDVAGERQWLLDPLDGTVAFVCGLPLWSTAVCLRDERGTAVAAVYDPVADEMYSASRNSPTSRNGTRVDAPANRSLREAVVRVWCDPTIAAEAEYLPAMGRLATRAGVIQAGGSGSLALAWIAAGRLHGFAELYPAREPKDWDWYPGELLIRQAGGSAAATGPWRTAATGAKLHAELLAALTGDN
jgi:myo-inositol-1(or 4)-monophosphatase